TATTVFDAATNAPWSGTETTGASAYDTASVSTSDGFVATGTVTYTFYGNGSCTGSGTSAGTVTLTASGAVPNSSTEGPLQAGSYSFQAVYSGDNNYAGSTGACEPFTVNIGSSQTATTVFDAATNAPWSGTETTGASAYDTAAVTPSDGFTATGTVTYAFFNNGACSGTGTSAGTVTLTAAGAVPNSSIEGPLAAGMYTFQASYSGDANYAGSTGPCEPFTVGKGSSNTVTTVVQNGTTTGASAYDTATVTTSDTIVATGTVTYNFFNNISCSAPGNSAGTVTLTATGAVPNSNVEGPPLAAGMYSFQASYSGDANYIGSTGACEPFTILPGNSTTATAVVQNGTTTGASAYDTATVTTTDTIVATGTVSYTFFNNGSCSGAGTSAGTVTLTASGSVPNSNSEGPLGAGSYSFQASYSGDSNYGGSTGPCEPFTVNKANSNTATSVFDETTNSSVPLNGTIGQGDTVHDTATVGTQIGSFVISGTVTYNFFLNNTCTAPAASSQTVTISGGKVPNSASNGPIASGAYSYQAVYSGDNNYNGSTSGCEPFAVTHVSQITPTQTTCSQFSGGTASTLTDVFYNTSGTAISNDNPGVLFYWVQVHASSAGAQTFTITQSTTYNPTTGARFFSVAAGSFAYDSSCNALSTTLSTSVSGGVQSLTVKFNAPAAGTYVIGIKYSPKSIVGSGPASTSHGPNYVYTFATTGVVGSTSTVNLTHS
ncbi:MAG TPA: Ig-like domain repeat protein, partial [Candidatus Dormibacteraeota bacterium]|nr:Ig-like domain repeat protein [Candidatus Dormibacteraeota bacterium]